MNKNRRLLIKLPILAGLSSIPGISYSAINTGDSDTERLAWKVIQLYKNTYSMAAVGDEYLKLHSEENTINKIIFNICGGCNDVKENLLGLSQEKLEEHFNNKILQDFNDRNIVSIHGWILSKTESRICALSSLL